MSNKSTVTTKAEAEAKLKRKEVINRINKLMDKSSDVEVRVSKDGRKYYQSSFRDYFNINKGTVSLYYNCETDIPKDLLIEISARLNCSIQYLLLTSDSINYEFDTVIKRTGLSEDAIEILTREHELSKDVPLVHGGYIDAINYLITEGSDFVKAFQIAKMHIDYFNQSYREHITSCGLSEEAVAVAFSTYDIGTATNTAYTEAIFKKEMLKYEFNIMGTKRALSDDEIHHLFEHSNAMMLFNPESRQYSCSKELTKIFTAIENSEK